MNVTLHLPSSASAVEALGRQVVQQMRALDQQRSARARAVLALETVERHRAWEQQWEQLTRIPWREWVRRLQPRRLRVLLAERSQDTRIWLDDREVQGLVTAVAIDAEVGEMGRLTITVPLSLVELL